MDEDAPNPRKRSWLDRLISVIALVVAVGLLLVNVFMTDTWTPVIYRIGAESDPYKLMQVRTLSACRGATLNFQLGALSAGAGDNQWGSLCMRRCWPFEDRWRPDAVQQIAGRCQVVVTEGM